MELRALVLVFVAMFIGNATAQFGFFDQMFGGQQQQQQQQQQNVRSDSSWYQAQYENAHCDKYLCPGTLSCVHFPHHCPCAWPSTEDKVELGEGIAMCASKGGYKEGETLKKIELARKGLL
ncbi:Long chronological lifespan protein 2 [Didymosphaeria variabile]|uniref:Long chronological lifespan protein 2 n=1 Tax=Didymosphaeria variabile TaxID=1932322 RepID=A0A9W8XD38_9PLEO|nr:Long chronological lifespan protein 2 [Didymosphaeria variabile]KAJ4346411.1 Long chronological lifespan protein 2 [Didymosphaeria variabile]